MKKISMCRMVVYKLSQGDVDRINEILPERVDNQQRRNAVSVGEQYPAMVVRVWSGGGSANLQVFLDGDCTYWATSRAEGNHEPGKWSWPDKKDD